MPIVLSKRVSIGISGVLIACSLSSCATVKSAVSHLVTTRRASSESSANAGASSSINTSTSVGNVIGVGSNAENKLIAGKQNVATAGVSPASWHDETQIAASTSPAYAGDNSKPAAQRSVTPTNNASTESLPVLQKKAPEQRILYLRDALQLAVSNNPDVITARAAGPVSDAARRAAAVYPWNPSVQVEVAPFARDIGGNQLATKNLVTIAQPVELAHQTRYRIRAAEAGWSEQQAIIAQSELTASVSAMRAYFDALYRMGLWKLAQDSQALQRRTAEATEHRFVAGLATPTERTTAHILERQSQRAADLAYADYQAALNSLRTILNLPLNGDMELGPSLEAINWQPSARLGGVAGHKSVSLDNGPASVETIDVSHRPDVFAAHLAASQARANLDLAKANTVPNISTGPTYERDESGTLFFGVTAQMDVPVWNTGGPLVRQRTAEYQQQLIAAEQTRHRAMLQAQTALQRYTIAYQMWQKQLALKAISAEDIRVVVDAFEHGQASFLEVLSVRDSLIQDRKGQLDLLREISQAAADVIAALAIDPDYLITPATSDDVKSAS